MTISGITSVSAAQEAQLTEAVSKIPQVKPPDRAVASAVAAANESNLFGPSNELAFAVDRRTHSFIVRLIDRATGTVVRQVPSEELLRLASSSSPDSFQTL